jgi:hypothetical protein
MPEMPPVNRSHHQHAARFVWYALTGDPNRPGKSGGQARDTNIIKF